MTTNEQQTKQHVTEERQRLVKKRKYLTQRERARIQQMLADGVKVSVIAARTGRYQSTIYRLKQELLDAPKTEVQPKQRKTPGLGWVVFADDGSTQILEPLADEQQALDRAASMRASGIPARLAREVAFEVKVSGIRSSE